MKPPKTECPFCKTVGAYIGVLSNECINKQCRFFSLKWKLEYDEMMEKYLTEQREAARYLQTKAKEVVDTLLGLFEEDPASTITKEHEIPEPPGGWLI